MTATFSKSANKRLEISKLLNEGYTIDQAEDVVLKGDKNRARTVKAWREAGAFPYGDIDKPQEQLHSANTEHCKEPLHTAITANTPAPLHTANTTIAQTPKDKPNTVSAKSNDSALDNRIRALIREVLAEQGTVKHTAIADIGEAPKLWRTTKNVVPISFRLQATLLRRARAALHDKYQGTMSLNRYIELCLWDLLGRPDDLLKPDK